MSDPKTRRQVLFYAEAEAGMYDSTIELVVPQYRVLHECLLELLGVAFRASGNPEGSGFGCGHRIGHRRGGSWVVAPVRWDAANRDKISAHRCTAF